MIRVLTSWIISLVIGLFLLPNISHAQLKPIVSDSRIRTLVYNANEVFQIYTEFGYQSNVEFGKNEKIETISIGDSVAFKITPASDRLFIKALQDNKHTNMTVITNERVYQFEISSIIRDAADITYVVRFYYPSKSIDAASGVKGGMAPPQMTKPSLPPAAVLQSAPPIGQAPSEVAAPIPVPRKPLVPPAPMPQEKIISDVFNQSYRVTGPKQLAPVKIFDNGRSTFFKFREGAAVADPHMVNPDGTESLLPSRKEGEYLVVDKVLPKFALRVGPDVLCVFNGRNAGNPVRVGGSRGGSQRSNSAG